MGTLAWQSLANVSILLCVIAALTVVLVLAYKFRCYCLINGWLILSSFLLLFLFSFLYVTEVLKVVTSKSNYYSILFYSMMTSYNCYIITMVQLQNC